MRYLLILLYSYYFPLCWIVERSYKFSDNCKTIFLGVEESLYTVVIGGKPTGPFPLTQLRALDIQPGTFIRKPGMDDYKEAHEMPELRELFGFRYQQTLPQYFASFDQRLVADVIDYLLMLLGYVILMLMFYAFLTRETFSYVAIGGLFLLGFARLTYGSIAEASPKQATLGKRLMDIKVTDLVGNRLTLANSFGRNFGKIISNIPLGFGNLYCFLNKKQQCVHDLIAGTLVVKQRLI